MESQLTDKADPVFFRRLIRIRRRRTTDQPGGLSSLFGLLVFTSASFWYISPSPFPGDVWRMRGFSLVIAVCPRIGFVSLESIFWRACRSFVRSLRPPQRPVFFFSLTNTHRHRHTQRDTRCCCCCCRTFFPTPTRTYGATTLSLRKKGPTTTTRTRTRFSRAHHANVVPFPSVVVHSRRRRRRRRMGGDQLATPPPALAK